MLKIFKKITMSFQLFSFKYLRKNLSYAILLIFLLLTVITPIHAQITVVQKYGQLAVSGNKIVDQSGAAVQLRGMSLYWSQWIPKYYNYNTIKWLRDDWKITVIRAAMGVNGNSDGYLVNPTAEKNKIIAVVDAAISLGIYVIIDWHDHDAHLHQSQAQAFFSEMAQRYANSPNVIWEIWNEPLNYSWASVIKPYHQAVISSIRQYDPNNIIVCGTRNWSQEVDEATASPITGNNIAYTLHYYANSHGAGLRTKATTALGRNRAIFVTEYGTTDASGNGTVSATASNEWWDFLDANKISHANWSVADISESSAALVSGASVEGGWTTSQIKQSGQLVRNEIRANAPDLSGITTVANGTYYIIARNSGKYLDVAGASTADSANIVQYTSNGAANQKWIVQSLSTGVYSIRASHSNKAMDLKGYSTADGGDINQYTYSGGNNQRWRIESVGSGYYRIVSVHSNKAVEITGNSTANNAGINQRTYSGATNQQFTFSLATAGRSDASILEQPIKLTVEVLANKESLVYPNPSGSHFNIRAKGVFTYTVKNSSGQTISNGKAVNQVSVGSKLIPGIYIVSIKTEAGQKEFKLVKQ
jgi:endoglucanase